MNQVFLNVDSKNQECVALHDTIYINQNFTHTQNSILFAKDIS